jgi:hypothetical protein
LTTHHHIITSSHHGKSWDETRMAREIGRSQLGGSQQLPKFPAYFGPLIKINRKGIRRFIVMNWNGKVA